MEAVRLYQSQASAEEEVEVAVVEELACCFLQNADAYPYVAIVSFRKLDLLLVL